MSACKATAAAVTALKRCNLFDKRGFTLFYIVLSRLLAANF